MPSTWKFTFVRVFSFSQVDWIYIIIYLVSEKVTLSNGIQLAKSTSYPNTKSKRSGNGECTQEDWCLFKGKKLLSKTNTIKTQNKTQIIQWMFSKYRFWRVSSSGFVYIPFQNVKSWKHDLTWYDLISQMGRRFIGIEPIRRKHFCKQHIFHGRPNAICIP